MKYNILGNSELRISEITFGGMSLSEDYREAKPLIHQAIDQGINFFDTADLYQKGQNEEVIGKALHGIRSELIIATKVGNELDPSGDSWNWNPSKSYILKAVEKSLIRLKTDYIDLYQLHGGMIEDPIEETIEAFETLKKEGKIRYYGISSIRPNVIREYVKLSNISSVMMQYSLLDRRPEETCFDLLKSHQIGVLARGVLAQGILAGKSPKKYLTREVNEVQLINDAVNKVANDNKVTASTVAMKYVINHPAVSSIVAGIRNKQQLNDLLRSLQVKNLSLGEINHLRKVIEPNLYEVHR